jgi:hypothetical protein
MALQYTINLPPSSVRVQVTAAWLPDAPAPPMFLKRPPPSPHTSEPPCELVLEATAAGSLCDLAVTLRCSARLIELRAQGASDREPQYIGTSRGEPAAEPSATGPMFQFVIPLPPGCVLMRLKLLSLADKGCCRLEHLEAVVQGQPQPQQPQQQQEQQGRSGTQGQESEGGVPDGRCAPPASVGALHSQLDELRLLVKHAAGALLC